ncbi:MAG TPA: TraR/DksA family transcriptional regulator [Thermoanaerobaculia bacterium]|nr:TraR/DksA family transcriptional regulator [Thermoanaerobaculia bacterium]
MSHLTPEQLEDYKERLLTAKASAGGLLGRTVGDEKPVQAAGSTIGRLSRMDAIQVQAMAQMSRRQLDIRLQQIEAALAALDAGNYGRCRQCKEPISLQRLEALPEAPLCMECQEALES